MKEIILLFFFALLFYNSTTRILFTRDTTEFAVPPLSFYLSPKGTLVSRYSHQQFSFFRRFLLHSWEPWLSLILPRTSADRQWFSRTGVGHIRELQCWGCEPLNWRFILPNKGFRFALISESYFSGQCTSSFYRAPCSKLSTTLLPLGTFTFLLFCCDVDKL